MTTTKAIIKSLENNSANELANYNINTTWPCK